MMLNVDGSLNAYDGIPRGGWVLHGEKGSWKGGFMCGAHSLHVTNAEAWTLMKGSEWAWRKGLRRLTIQSDSIEVFDFIHMRKDNSDDDVF